MGLPAQKETDVALQAVNIGPLRSGTSAGAGAGVNLTGKLGAPPPVVRLKATAVAVPALASHVRPALVLAERESRELLRAAAAQDVGSGGCFAAGPAGIQVWNQPFDGPNGTHGNARHLGSVDWSYDTPAKHYVTIYRAMVTQAGVDAGETTLSILSLVLGLGGLPVEGARITMPLPPPRDPFRRAMTPDGLSPEQRAQVGF